jgi:hypothetical protein
MASSENDLPVDLFNDLPDARAPLALRLSRFNCRDAPEAVRRSRFALCATRFAFVIECSG